MNTRAPASLHFVIHDGDGWRDYLDFRDRLRASLRLRSRYETLKSSSQPTIQTAADFTPSQKPPSSGCGDGVV